MQVNLIEVISLIVGIIAAGVVLWILISKDAQNQAKKQGQMGDKREGNQDE